MVDKCEKSFQDDVIDRLARIEEKQDATATTVCDHTKEIREQGLQVARVDESAKSAHKRIDGIYAAAAIVGGVAGWISQLLASIWPKGGH